MVHGFLLAVKNVPIPACIIRGQPRLQKGWHILTKNVTVDVIYLADVAQLVRALDCGSGGRGFEPHHSPQISI